MAKHKFMVTINQGDKIVGVQCIGCGQIAMYESGKVPDDIREQECKREDESQAAARIVREATK